MDEVKLHIAKRGICGKKFQDFFHMLKVKACNCGNGTQTMTVLFPCVQQILKTDGDTGFMHESFNKDDAKDFTRSWFAWANTLFGELIVDMYAE